MKPQAEDRRSLRTRQALIQALIELLTSQPYDQITVQDIAAKANVGRSTFYAHFEHKDQLLKGGFESLLDTLVEHIVLDQVTGDPAFDVTMLFQHAVGHFNLYRALIWGSGFDVLTMGGHATLSEKIEKRLSHLMQGKNPAFIPFACSGLLCRRVIVDPAQMVVG